ncbi:hypothetical protein M426DRAFT_316771 [Hypoxylon sp. CI-4A]|nr:hypothetical protein M426DRAFT_316771 [Hypoxylon sp. CI-4A]
MADEVRQTPVPVPHVVGQPEATAQQASVETSTAAGADEDVEMTAAQASVEPDTKTEVPSTEQAPATTSASAPATAATGRTGTPLRTTAAAANGDKDKDTATSSRATSQHPDTMPAEAPAHGDPVRQYFNSQVTGPLLEGMKILARNQPKNPLLFLGEYLIGRHKEALENHKEAESSSQT